MTYYAILSTFAFFQIIFILGALFGWISLKAFFIELAAFTVAIVLAVNMYLINMYCKYTGTPYKKKRYYEAVRWIGLVAGYWTIAFSAKFFMIIFG